MFGFVGQRVDPPTWDDGGADEHYYLLHMFAGEATGVDRLHEWLGIHVAPLVRGNVEKTANDYYTFSFATETELGDYDAQLRAPPVSKEPPHVVRLWANSTDPESGAIRHRSIDITDTHATSSWQAASGWGHLLHWNTAYHGANVADNNVGAQNAPAWSLVYGPFDRSLTFGPEFTEAV